MARYLQQLRPEYDILRDKCETYAAQKAAISEEMEIQLKQSRRQIHELEGRLSELTALHESEMRDVQRQFAQELQSHQMQSNSSRDSMEKEMLRLRKELEKEILRLKKELEKKDIQINECNNEMRRYMADTDYEHLLLKEERDQLLTQNGAQKRELKEADEDIEQLKKTHLEELRAQKNKLETQYLSELEGMKRTHLKQLQEVQREKDKVSDLADEKERDAEDLAAKLERQKRSN